MTRFRIIVVSLLCALPVVFLLGVGAYHLWATGWSFIAWFPIVGCFAAAYLLTWVWTKRRVAELKLPTTSDELPNYWTDRDRLAWKEVQAFIAEAKPLKPDETANVERYATEAQALALRLVRLDRPTATDPFGHLTLPELLTCAELVTQELNDMTVTYLPGSHLVRIDDLKLARRAVDWYEKGRDVYWAASAVINPLKAATQFLVTKIGLQTPMEQLRHSALQWFHVTYLKEVGRYLIELNSGRLKVGAKTYRELMALHRDPARGHEPTEPATDLRPLTIAILGQVKAGKSSLVNALLGEAKAGVAVTPETMGATKYVFAQDGQPLFVLVDSAGYGLDGANERDIAAATELAKSADLIVMVAHARSAGRKADLAFLDAVRAEYGKQPGLILPTIVIALTHIDLLTPAVEWQPPYDWESGDRPKERSIRESVTATRETFGPRVAAVVPVCTRTGNEYGVSDHLLTTLLGRIGEARGVAIVRALEAESKKRSLSKIGDQLLAAGRKMYATFVNV